MPGKKPHPIIKAPPPLKYRPATDMQNNEVGPDIGNTFITAGENLQDPFKKAPSKFPTKHESQTPKQQQDTHRHVITPPNRQTESELDLQHTENNLLSSYDKNEQKLIKNMGLVISIHQFSIKNGHCVENSPEYQTFKRTNITKWG